MVLNFGNNGLFNTSNEERWKGINTDRIEEFPSAASALDNYPNVPNVWTATTATVTLNVKPDEKVIVFASATGEQDNDNEDCHIKIVRNATDIGVEAWIDSENPTDDILITAGMTAHTVDNPGEGNHTYTVYAKTAYGTSDIKNIMITAFVLTVK